MNKNLITGGIKITLGLCILGVIVYGGYKFYKNLDDGSLIGAVETTVYANMSESTGKIEKLNVEPGMSLKKGDIIAVVDDTNLNFLLTQAEANLIKSQEALVGISGSADTNAVKSAISATKISKTAYENAKLLYEKAKMDYDKNKALYDAGGTSQSALENYKLLMDQSANALMIAKSQIDSADAALNSVVNGAGSDKIKSAKASIISAQSQVDQIKDQISKSTIRAVCDGTVISRNYVLGDFVSPGFDIADIASIDDRYIKIYYPSDQINEVVFGQNMNIVAGEEKYTGRVSFIDLESEYTPTDMQSSQNRNKDSVIVRIKIEEDVPLKVGERVYVFTA